jgi:hypothetical protein
VLPVSGGEHALPRHVGAEELVRQQSIIEAPLDHRPPEDEAGRKPA